MVSCLCKTPKEKPFILNDLYLTTFCNKLKGRKRELILNGRDLQYLKGRRLYDSDMVTICEWLTEHPDVVSLDFSYNCFTDKGAKTLAHFLENSCGIRRLNLMCNDIEAQGAKAFADVGSKLEVQSLRLNGNKIGEEGGKFIASLIQSNSNLLHLDIAETDQNGTSLAYILAALHSDQDTKSNLKLLDISRPLGYGCSYYKYDSRHAMEAIGNMMKVNTYITELHLQKMGIVCSDIPLLTLGLKHNRTLILLDLQVNYIGCDGAEALANWLETSNLRGLMLSHNNIDDLGAVAMGYKLPSSRIKLLDLAYNKITAKGLLFLLDTIKKAYKLDILYIWGNKFSNQVCRRIKRMLISGVLTQNNLDVQIYNVDGINYAALYSVDRYKHIYYCVGDYAFPQPLRISKPHEDLIPTQVLNHSITRKHKGIHCVCPQAIKLLDEFDVEKKSTDQDEFLSIMYESEGNADCRHSSLFTMGSIKTFPHMEYQKQEDTFRESAEDEEQKPNLFFQKRKVRNLIMDMRERKQQQMKEYCYKDMKSIIYQIVEGFEKVQKSKKQEAKCPSTLLHKDIDIDSKEMVETEVAEVQTSFPLLRSQYFSFELRSSYPLTSYSIADMELAKKNKIDILADVQDAYVRKYEQPNILQEERYDLCNDPYYRINDSPFIITHVADEKPVEAEGEGETQQEILVAKAESTISEKEEKLRPMFSTYEILERNIHGVPLTRPLSKDAKEEMFKKHRESSTSESMETLNADSVFTMMDEGTQTEASVLD